MQLLRLAQRAGVSQLAITDHDTVAGYRVARRAPEAARRGFRLVAGVELSCQWANTTIHVLGLDMEIDHPVLQRGLEQLQCGRRQRAAIIADRLAAAGIPDALPGALAVAAGGQIGRPHFAAWMVAAGHVRTADDAFRRYLGAGKMGDVKTVWPALATVTGWVVQAGGSALLAHPLHYRMTAAKRRRLLADFVAAGGTGLEVCNGRQPPQQVQELAALALQFQLEVSAGSDFHRPFAHGPQLGIDVARLPVGSALWQPAPA